MDIGIALCFLVALSFCIYFAVRTAVIDGINQSRLFKKDDPQDEEDSVGSDEPTGSSRKP